MANLLESYSNFFTEKSFIKDIASDCCDLNAEKKIRKFFCLHDKSRCFAAFENDKYKLTRTFHSMSVYLLGLYFLTNGLNEEFNNFGTSCKNFEFNSFDNMKIEEYVKQKKLTNEENYIWTLTSLYHDVVSAKENCNDLSKYLDDDKVTPNSFINSSKEFGDEKIKYTIFNTYRKIDDVTKIDDENITKVFLSEEKNDFTPTYSKKLVEGYFRKRLYDSKIDHGIVSGYLFYDALVKNCLEKIDKKRRILKTKEGFTYRPEHLILFKYIADAIICHNIWRYDDESKPEYEKFKIADEALLENTNLLTKDKNPLLFFLCLVDTLEPTKVFKSNSVLEVLENIEIKIENDKEAKKTIITSAVGTLPIKDKAEWFSRIESMKKWMNLDVSNLDGTSCKITIK